MTGVQQQFEVGASLPPLRKVMSQDEMTAFEVCSTGMMEARAVTANIHTDPEMARAAGLGSPIASGMMTTAYLNQLLRQSFGDAWSKSGHLSIAFIGSLRSGDEAIAHAVVKGRSEDGTRLQLEVWCENQQGDKVTVGSADVSLAGD
jgi:acyl dehydratase